MRIYLNIFTIGNFVNKINVNYVNGNKSYFNRGPQYGKERICFFF